MSVKVPSWIRIRIRMSLKKYPYPYPYPYEFQKNIRIRIRIRISVSKNIRNIRLSVSVSVSVCNSSPMGQLCPSEKSIWIEIRCMCTVQSALHMHVISYMTFVIYSMDGAYHTTLYVWLVNKRHAFTVVVVVIAGSIGSCDH